MSSNVPGTKVSLDLLRGPRLKAERADKHLNDLMAAAQDLPRDLYSFQVELCTTPPHANPTHFELAYKPLKPVPETFALIIGDAVHNLRAALDHFASGVIRSIPGKEKATPYFPVTKKRENLENSGDLKLMEQALPGSKELLLEKIRPIDNGRDHLWSFGSLDIDDKHNLIVPTVTVASINGINAQFGGITISDGGAGNDAAKPFVFIRSRNPITLKGDPHTSIDVSFGVGTPFDGHPVIPTLLDVRNLVTETLDSFERLVVRTTARVI